MSSAFYMLPVGKFSSLVDSIDFILISLEKPRAAGEEKELSKTFRHARLNFKTK